MRFGGILLRLVVAVFGLVLIGGCSDPEPKEPKATSSPTPTITVPTMPSQAKENSPEGAAAFVKHYIDVFNYASNTGDVTELRALSTSCEPCEKYAKQFLAIYKRGDRITAHLWTLKAMEVETDDTTRVTAGIDVDEGDTTNRNRLVFTLPADPPFTVSNIAILEGS